MAGLDLSRVLNSNKSSIFLSGIPIPPTSNHQYSTIVRGGKAIRFPSKETKAYATLFNAWALRNKIQINNAVSKLEAWRSPLEIRCYIIFKKQRLITKDLFMKKLDISNRTKALHDLLSKALQIDDCHFVSNINEKIISDNDDEQVVVVIQPLKMRFETQLYDALEKEGVMNE